MTVKELIELLEDQDPDKKVRICVTDDGHSLWEVKRVIGFPNTVDIDCGW